MNLKIHQHIVSDPCFRTIPTPTADNSPRQGNGNLNSTITKKDPIKDGVSLVIVLTYLHFCLE